MNIVSSRPSNYFNVTWSFNVSKNAMHFVRVHFCDFLAAPFYDEFVVDSDDSGIMNISIGPRQDSGNRTAFLNGLEIMEIMGELGKVARTSDPKNKNTSVFVVVGSVLGGLVLICILAVVLCLGRRCRKPKAMETLDWSPVPVHRGGSTDSRLQVPEGAMYGSLTPNLNLGLRISLAEIQFATNNFDIKKKIGKGGFGTVFRGTLSNGSEVAVKRSMPGSHQGLPEFQTEIIVLSKIRHRHLVSLIGYCDENSEMILVYEFMEKGTLRDHLYDSAFPSLPWKQRLEICIGAANGLHYLHRGSSGGFIHRDVKSTNVLLDENYVAKVADFGLSRLSGPPDQTHVSTVVKGTFGYLDPDYFKTQQLTEKSDVYSFGVVLLEVLCARPAINTLLPLEQVNLAEWAMFCKKKGMLEQIVDASIRSEINLNCLRKFFDTAERCLEEYGVDRPNMGDVVWDLEYALQLQRTAMPRELHEDSTTDASAMLALPNIQHLPSLSMSMERDDMPMLREDLSNSPAIEVFSQLRIDDAR
ncbi:receptor-like protein kinase [Populus alba x Populus x berolinensis]|uniref:Receptor-like protein kinase n=1 Tax=Populus alba x Populus x berolinensis TaxID=444605 RepID=A0AAD6W310_9ROSI|nr:receptor-like protein kinase [Populus alba x Populus x berolinensis]